MTLTLCLPMGGGRVSVTGGALGITHHMRHRCLAASLVSSHPEMRISLSLLQFTEKSAYMRLVFLVLQS